MARVEKMLATIHDLGCKKRLHEISVFFTYFRALGIP
jgi:hypothetical protein